jgi:hypothetical protein
MLRERLQGLLLIVAGCVALLLVHLAQQAGWFQLRPPTPPGLRPELLPVITPLSCLLPMVALGGLGLCLVGLKKLFAPDDWQPPKHLR